MLGFFPLLFMMKEEKTNLSNDGLHQIKLTKHCK